MKKRKSDRLNDLYSKALPLILKTYINEGSFEEFSSGCDSYIEEEGGEKFKELVDKYLLIHEAASSPHKTFLGYLLEKNIDVEMRDAKQNTALHVAASMNRTENISILLEKGININPINVDKKTPLTLAATEGYANIVKFLIEKKADVTIIDNEGNTLINHAVINDHIDVVDIILKTNKINVLTLNNEGKNSVFYAANKGSIKMMELFLQKVNIGDMEFSIRTHLDCSLFHIAAEKGNLAMMELLVRENADINALNKQGETPLHIAVKSNHISIVEFLLNKKSKSNILNKEGNSPLHDAVNSLSSSSVKLLLDHNANACKTDALGNTALHLALKKFKEGNNSNDKKGRFFEILHSLSMQKTNVHVTNDEKISALDLATEIGDNKALQFFKNRFGLSVAPSYGAQSTNSSSFPPNGQQGVLSNLSYSGQLTQPNQNRALSNPIQPWPSALQMPQANSPYVTQMNQYQSSSFPVQQPTLTNPSHIIQQNQPSNSFVAGAQRMPCTCSSYVTPMKQYQGSSTPTQQVLNSQLNSNTFTSLQQQGQSSSVLVQQGNLSHVERLNQSSDSLSSGFGK